MKRRLNHQGLILSVLALAGLATSALAHHSFGAIFDAERELALSGVLTKVEWVNPHSYYYVEVKGANGAAKTWAFESFPPAMLRRLGLTRDAMTSNIGKKVKVLYNPAHKKDQALGYGRVFEFEGGTRIVFTPPNEDGTAPATTGSSVTTR